MQGSRAAAWSLGVSFCVYLIPLFGPHAAWFVGELLFQGDAHRSPLWIAANFAVAVLVQLLAAGFFYWFFGKPGWLRAFPLVLFFPGVFSILQWVYLVAIPARFLEEPDTSAENASWPAACTAPGEAQTNLRTASELWVRANARPNAYSVLTMPGCRLATVTLPQQVFSTKTGVDFMIDPTSVISGGRAIVRKWETKKARETWWLTPGAFPESDASLLPLEPPAGRSGNNGPPILSTDGQWVAWVAAIPNTGPPLLYRVFLQPRNPGEKEIIVDLSALGPASYVLEKLDTQSRELTLWKTDHLVRVRLDGTVAKEFPRPPTVSAQWTTYVELGDYWLAWDAYREDGPYRIEWRLPAGSGSHRVPLGRSIHSAAVDTAGKWIAVSVGTSLNIGKARDAVYVLRAADGREVFRKYLPPFNRSPVAFLDGGFFVYSDLSGVRVLRIPE